MIEVLAAVAGLASAGLGITVAIMGIRNGGLKADAREADQDRKAAEAALMVAAKEFDDYRLRAESKEALLVKELEHYENQELAAIEAEPDQVVRIRRRRRLVGGVLSEAFTPAGDDSDPGVPEDSSPE